MESPDATRGACLVVPQGPSFTSRGPAAAAASFPHLQRFPKVQISWQSNRLHITAFLRKHGLTPSSRLRTHRPRPQRVIFCFFTARTSHG